MSTPQYYLKIRGEKVRVCRELFLSTFGLKRAMVRNWLNNFHDQGFLRASDADALLMEMNLTKRRKTLMK
ncbi:hypothetical protein JTE90_002345 [Oedothorax gibbosus]|uniref:Transposase n=1 Tax=Oedothorax gibbosus TaxID=931172 RepID=A0AAV6ULE3_9ARAC|nr:hypothetical protein JTE90_002345 [Oedothorax gibbosus]